MQKIYICVKKRIPPYSQLPNNQYLTCCPISLCPLLLHTLWFSPSSFYKAWTAAGTQINVHQIMGDQMRPMILCTDLLLLHQLHYRYFQKQFQQAWVTQWKLGVRTRHGHWWLRCQVCLRGRWWHDLPRALTRSPSDEKDAGLSVCDAQG